MPAGESRYVLFICATERWCDGMRYDSASRVHIDPTLDGGFNYRVECDGEESEYRVEPDRADIVHGLLHLMLGHGKSVRHALPLAMMAVSAIMLG